MTAGASSRGRRKGRRAARSGLLSALDAAHFEHVAAGAEGLVAGASEDEDGDIGVFAGAEDRVSELVAEGVVQGVVAFGAVQGEADDRSAAFFDDEWFRCGHLRRSLETLVGDGHGGRLWRL